MACSVRSERKIPARQPLKSDRVSRLLEGNLKMRKNGGLWFCRLQYSTMQDAAVNVGKMAPYFIVCASGNAGRSPRTELLYDARSCSLFEVKKDIAASRGNGSDRRRNRESAARGTSKRLRACACVSPAAAAHPGPNYLISYHHQHPRRADLLVHLLAVRAIYRRD